MEEFIKMFGGIKLGTILLLGIALYWLCKVLYKIYLDIVAFHNTLESLQSYGKKEGLFAEGLMGLMRYRLVRECHKAINDGYITDDRLEIIDDLYEPYKELGGNGVAKKYVNDVKKLPIREQ